MTHEELARLLMEASDWLHDNRSYMERGTGLEAVSLSERLADAASSMQLPSCRRCGDESGTAHTCCGGEA